MYNNLSIAFLQEKKLKEAIQSWDKAIKLKPDFSGLFWSNAYSNLKDYSNAINNFNKAIEIKKDYKNITILEVCMLI